MPRKGKTVLKLSQIKKRPSTAFYASEPFFIPKKLIFKENSKIWVCSSLRGVPCLPVRCQACGSWYYPGPVPKATSVSDSKNPLTSCLNYFHSAVRCQINTACWNEEIKWRACFKHAVVPMGIPQETPSALHRSLPSDSYRPYVLTPSVTPHV